MTTLYEDYTEEQLKEAFDSVANPDDWRAPIRADIRVLPMNAYYEVHPTDFGAIQAAIRFYTGTEASFELVGSVVRIIASGYRNGPCGP